MRKAAIGLLLLVVALPMCTGVPLMAPSDSTITLFANPEFVPANGGVSVVTAVVIEPAGTPVPNGTEVSFFTNLGRVDPEAKTKDGIARVNFVSDSRSGMATVTAQSGGAAVPAPTTTMAPMSRLSFGMAVAHAQASGTNSASITITVGSALPETVIVTANPGRITSPRSALITANVFDERGNPVFNVPVFFSLGNVTIVPPPTTTTTTSTTVPPAPLIEETLASGGAPQFTDTNGQAFDWLQTRSLPGGPQKRVFVHAETPTGVAGEAEVFIN